ncbi:MAG TPA: N-acetylmuramoyl-L-alanine amidase [Nitrospiria bacterium]|nr:N-acetylmuramoyl-L-alanine amidase [Nitrospiria bacterium]
MRRFVLLTALVFLCLPLLPHGEVSAVSPRTLLSLAEACSSSVDNLPPEKRKEPKRWDRCIRKFESTLKGIGSSDDDTAARASYGLGEAYLSRFEARKEPGDLDSAREAYRKVLDFSNRGKWARRAQIRLKTLDGYDSENPSKCRNSGEKCPGSSTALEITALRHWSHPDYTRVVIDMSSAPKFQKEEKKEKNRTELVFTFQNTRLAGKIPPVISIRDGVAREVRTRQQGKESAVLILLASPYTYKIISLTEPDRLVVDLLRQEDPQKTETTEKSDERPPVVKSSLEDMPKLDIRTIVIDPGHGGKDPGAIGRNGLTEKEVVLDIGLRLRKLVIKRLKKKVLMTRSTDVFIPLEERTFMANAKRADLFISIHANASTSRDTRGIEVYLLGRASDDRAMETAARENSTSTAAATDFQKLILNDLRKDFNINESLELAHTVSNAITEKVLPRYPTNDLGVKRAPFFVLANSHMPAILAEISFVSNPLEEKRLRSPSYRQRMAEALFAGLERYIASFKESF